LELCDNLGIHNNKAIETLKALAIRQKAPPGSPTLSAFALILYELTQG
jgi:hypothetical protein